MAAFTGTGASVVRPRYIRGRTLGNNIASLIGNWTQLKDPAGVFLGAFLLEDHHRAHRQEHLYSPPASAEPLAKKTSSTLRTPELFISSRIPAISEAREGTTRTKKTIRIIRISDVDRPPSARPPTRRGKCDYIRFKYFLEGNLTRLS